MDVNHTSHGRPHERRYTVNEAAEVLGISAEAVRARINRGTLHKDKDEDGTVYVRMNAVHTHPDGDAAADHTSPNDLAFQIMQDQIAFLRAELERKDHLLAAALERIPAIEAPSEPRESPTMSFEEGNGTQPPEPERRPWWRRLFGP